MKPIFAPQGDSIGHRRDAAQAGVRTLLAAAICLLAGLGLGVLWHSRSIRQAEVDPVAEAPVQEGGGLSAATRALLRSLKSPVQIRLYAVLDAASAPEDASRFAGRIEELLSSYQRESGGRLTVTSFRSSSDLSAAAAAGMKPFNLEKGDVCYLGLTVIQGERRESLPRLSPEWEQALESDVSRAISRVLAPPVAESSVTAALPPDPAIIEEVKRRIPDFTSVSLEAGSQLLREAALKDLQTALGQMAGQLKEAEQQVARMEEAKSESGKQEAVNELRRLQAEQAAKLKGFTTRSSAQIQALRHLKESAR